MSRERVSRFAIVVGLVALLLAVLAPAVDARSSIILRTSKPSGDPGLIDTSVQNVVYDASAGTIAVTATVQCFSEAASLIFVDFSATQTRGGTTRLGTSFNDDLNCNESFTEVILTEGGFVPGPATIEVSGFACSFSCTSETLRAEVVLIP
jgi:hypothetical protein